MKKRAGNTIGKLIFGAVFAASGLYHLIAPEVFMKIMPPYLPWHYSLVIVSGVAELVLAVTLQVPRLGRWAAWGLIALLIAVFPANIHMLLNSDQYPNIPYVLLLLRLPLQGLLIWWAYRYTGPDQ